MSSCCMSATLLSVVASFSNPTSYRFFTVTT